MGRIVQQGAREIAARVIAEGGTIARAAKESGVDRRSITRWISNDDPAWVAAVELAGGWSESDLRMIARLDEEIPDDEESHGELVETDYSDREPIKERIGRLNHWALDRVEAMLDSADPRLRLQAAKLALQMSAAVGLLR